MPPAEVAEVESTPQPVAEFAMLSTRVENKHVEADRAGVAEALAAANADGWFLVGQPQFIGNHVDLWFERHVSDDAN